MHGLPWSVGRAIGDEVPFVGVERLEVKEATSTLTEVGIVLCYEGIFCRGEEVGAIAGEEGVAPCSVALDRGGGRALRLVAVDEEGGIGEGSTREGVEPLMLLLVALEEP